MLVVKKFGGSSVADKERIFNVARRCAEEYQMGNDVIVVLSAMGDTTDELLEKAAEINPYPSKRELDMLLTTGLKCCQPCGFLPCLWLFCLASRQE